MNLSRDQSPIIYTQWETRVLECGGTKWESGNPIPNTNLVFCTCDHIHNLINLVEKNGLQNKLTVVSAASDYGLEYQEPSFKDMARWLTMIDYSTLGQRDLYVPARLDQETCLSAHKFTTKMYSWKKATFDSIPFKKWYCTNANVDEPNVVQIPFGLDEVSYELIQKYKGLEKEERLFVCFSSNTNERHAMKKALSKSEGVAYFEDIDKERYIYELCKSKYVMAPRGNGTDSYRCLEAIYAGSIPIIEFDNWSRCYTSLVGQMVNGIISTRQSKFTEYFEYHIKNILELI